MTGLTPPKVLSYEGQVAVPFINRPFSPTSSNFQFDVPTIWSNTSAEIGYILLGKPMNVADWQPFAGGSVTIQKLQGNSGGAVGPTNNLINLVGDGTYIQTIGTPSTSTLLIEPAGGIALTYTENTGTATASSGNLNVNGSQGILTQGSGSTITIQGQPSVASASSSLSNLGVSSFNSSSFTVDSNGYVNLIGNSQAISKINVDAETSPGTNPVIAASGSITITGGQIASGMTANVIQTNSLAANTFTIQIQRSQAVSSSVVADNGVSHFDNSKFSVDSNGFVSLSSAFYTTGNFTPSLTFGGSSTGITYSTTPSGTYTKIGNIVMFSLGLTLTSKGSATGVASITGLPITSGVGNNVLMNATEITLPSQTFQILGEISSTSTTVVLVCSSGTSPGTSAQMDNTFFLNNTSMQLEGFYYAT
jgi:hypothetical protein